MTDIRTRQGDIQTFMDALSDYVDARIQLASVDSNYASASVDRVLKTAVDLEQAVERLIIPL